MRKGGEAEEYFQHPYTRRKSGWATILLHLQLRRSIASQKLQGRIDIFVTKETYKEMVDLMVSLQVPD